MRAAERAAGWRAPARERARRRGRPGARRSCPRGVPDADRASRRRSAPRGSRSPSTASRARGARRSARAPARRRNPRPRGRRCTACMTLWLQDIESLEAISQDDGDARKRHRPAHWPSSRAARASLQFRSSRELDVRTADARRCRSQGELRASSRKTLTLPERRRGRTCAATRASLSRERPRARLATATASSQGAVCAARRRDAVVHRAERASRATRLRRSTQMRQWAILDSNQGPPPYQSGALTN